MIWHAFLVSDVLNVEQTKSVVAKSDLIDGNIPYVTRTVTDNGYTRTCGNADKVNKGNCITIGAETGVAFYQPNDFVAGNKVYRLSRDGLGESEYLFLASLLNKQTKNYSYSNARIPEKIKAETIMLPVRPSSDPSHVYTPADIDWGYMQERIAELEQERIAELEQERIAELDAYLKATGLDDYELTDEDKETLSLSQVSTSDEADDLENTGEDGKETVKDFKMTKLFNVFHGCRLTKQNRIPGNIPLLTAGEQNQGVAGYIGNAEMACYKDPITVDMFGNCFFHSGLFTGDDNIYFFVNDSISDDAKLYIAAVIEKQTKEQYSYAKQFRQPMADSLTVPLPVTSSGDLDYDYMEHYIRAIEKLTIANVVKYKNRVIAETKKIVDGSEASS